MEGRLTFEIAAPWLCLAAGSYVASKALFGISTLLSHVSAYTILETLRRDFIEKLMRASLGTVQEKSIGQIKNVFLDRIEGIEVPLAHMIPSFPGRRSSPWGSRRGSWPSTGAWRRPASCPCP